MRLRVLALLALFGLALGFTAPAQAADKPTVVLRINSLENLVADAVYVGTLAGQKENAEQVEGLFKSMVTEKGLEGFDTKKPIGMYARVAADLVNSDAVVLLPVASEDAVIDLLDRQGIPYEKKEGGLYQFTIPNAPFPGFFRFANGYAYVTARDEKFIDPKTILKPGDVLGTFKEVGSLTINLDTIPEQTRNMMLGQLERQVEEAKEQAPGRETEAQKALRLAAITEVFNQVTALVNGGEALNLALTIDRKAEELSFNFTLNGKDGSPLAKQIADLGTLKSLGAALMNDGAAASDYGHITIPEGVRKALGTAYDEMVEKAVENGKTEAQRKVTQKILTALGSTVKAGVLDAGGQIMGPDAGGKYTVVAGMAIQDGLALEKSLKELVDLIPDREREKVDIKIDRAKLGDINVHSLTIPNEDDETEQMKKALGDLTVYAALRDDAIFVTIGSQAMSALKTAVKAKPTASQVLRGEISMAKLIPLIPADERKVAEDISKEVFGDQAAGDSITWSLTGGKKINLKVTMKGKLLEFFAKIGMARQEF